MSIHTFTNQTIFHKVLGRNYVVAPGASIDLDYLKLIPQDLSDIAKGHFSVDPPLPPCSAGESIGGTIGTFNEHTTDYHEDLLIRWACSGDTQIRFTECSLIPISGGPSGGAGIEINIITANGVGVQNPFNNYETFDLATTGSAELLDPDTLDPIVNPLQITGGIVSVVIKDAVAETIALTLSNSLNGLNVDDVLQITFS